MDSTVRLPPWSDLVAAILAGLLGSLLAGGGPLVLRVPFVLLAFFVVPGYLLLEAVVPRRPDRASEELLQGPAARSAIVVAVSTALAVLVGVLLNFTAGVTPAAVQGYLFGATILLGGLAAARRANGPPVRDALSLPRLAGQGLGDVVLTLLLAAAILFVVVVAVRAVMEPRDAEPFTEFYILGASGAPDCLPRLYNGSYQGSRVEGCAGPFDVVTLGIVNHEKAPRTYWVRGLWTSEVLRDDNSTAVVDVQEWTRWSVDLDPVPAVSEPGHRPTPQWEEAVQLPPPPQNGTWRLSFQLFTEEPPQAEPSGDLLTAPYRHVHLWIVSVDPA